jgi:phosphoenolpyruvate---glycerone phosphotransferase subunit DhaL
MRNIDSEDIKGIFSKINDVMKENQDYLVKLDSIIGDGDLGLTMSNGFTKINEDLVGFDEDNIGKIFIKAGTILSDISQSATGTLIANGLIKGGMAIKDKKKINLSDLTLFFSEFINMIIITGKAGCGEKTLVDSFYPAIRSLENSLSSNQDLKESFKDAYLNAKSGLESTKEMISKHGRARWYGEKSIGLEDPGAAAGMLFIKAFYDYFNEKNI